MFSYLLFASVLETWGDDAAHLTLCTVQIPSLVIVASVGAAASLCSAIKDYFSWQKGEVGHTY